MAKQDARVTQMINRSTLTIGDRLNEASARRVHVSDITDPMVRALFWKRHEVEQAAIIRENSALATEFGHLIDDAEREAEYARSRRMTILQDLWDARRLERAAVAVAA